MAIPDWWRVATLGDFADVIMGQSPPGETYNEHGLGAPLINGPSEFGPHSPTPVQWTTEVIRTCEVGDVLFCVRGSTTGRQNRADRMYCIGRGIAAIRGKPYHCDTGYISHVLASISSEVLRRAKGAGSTFPNIGRDELTAWPTLLPPLPEQKKIAAILSSVDEVIAKTEAVIAQLQIVKKAMMEQLLTKGMPGRHTRFKQTEIGEIPEEWEVVPLYSVATVQTGIAKGKAVGEEALSVPYLRVANVQDGFIDLTEIKEIEVTPEQLPRFSLQTGDVLFCEGGDADKVGRGTVWLGQITPCLHQNHVFAVRPQLSKLIPEFLSMVRSSNSGKQYFLDSAKQTTNLASINSTQLKSFPTPLPSTEEQHEIVATIASIVAALDKEQGVLSSCQSLKSALSSSLLSGEIRVIPEVA